MHNAASKSGSTTYTEAFSSVWGCTVAQLQESLQAALPNFIAIEYKLDGDEYALSAAVKALRRQEELARLKSRRRRSRDSHGSPSRGNQGPPSRGTRWSPSR